MSRVAHGGVALIAVGVIAFSGCSSSKPSSRGSATSTTVTSLSPAVTTTSSASTTTSLAPGQTATTPKPVSTSTTAAGRVVSDPSASVHLGDTGSGVRQIQTRLVVHGYPVAVDGQFGNQTQQAVMRFQKNKGLTQDGIVGPVTWAKLQAPPSSSSTTTSKSTTTVKSTTTTT
jgi:peptidoglycan hydrolase-like protein with peptidoglycan-binding domain